MSDEAQSRSIEEWAQLATTSAPAKHQDSLAALRGYVDKGTIKAVAKPAAVVLPPFVGSFRMKGALSAVEQRLWENESRASQGSLLDSRGKPKQPATPSAHAMAAPPPTQYLDASEVLKIAHIEEAVGRWSEEAWVACGGRPEATDHVLTKHLTRPGTGIYEKYFGLKSDGPKTKPVKLASLLKKDWLAHAKKANGRLISPSLVKAALEAQGYKPVLHRDPSDLVPDNVKPLNKTTNRLGK